MLTPLIIAILIILVALGRGIGCVAGQRIIVIVSETLRPARAAAVGHVDDAVGDVIRNRGAAAGLAEGGKATIGIEGASRDPCITPRPLSDLIVGLVFNLVQ